MTKRLESEVAIITGSDSGMGQAMAEAFAKEGANIAIVYLHDKNGAEETCRRVEAAGQQAIILQIDQRNATQIKQLFEITEDKLGTPFILINDAGIDSTGKNVDEIPIED